MKHELKPELKAFCIAKKMPGVAHILDDPEFSVEQLAQSMHVDRSHLFRKCKELVAMSPTPR